MNRRVTAVLAIGLVLALAGAAKAGILIGMDIQTAGDPLYGGTRDGLTNTNYNFMREPNQGRFIAIMRGQQK